MTEIKNSRRKFYDILTVILFLLSAWALFEMVYDVCNMLGSVVSGTHEKAAYDLKRVFPILLSGACGIYMLVYTFDAYRAKNVTLCRKIWKINGIISIIAGVVVILYTAWGIISGTYALAVEGFPTPLFPLDVLINGIVITAVGVLSIRYGGRQTNKNFVSCGIKGKFRVFHVLSLAVALFSFMGFAYGTYVLDWKHGGILFNIDTLLIYFSAFAMAAVYRFVYAEAQPKKRAAIEIKAGGLFLAVNILLIAVHIITVNINSELPGQNAFGIMPIDFTAGINVFLPVMGLNNILAPLAALTDGLKKAGKK